MQFSLYLHSNKSQRFVQTASTVEALQKDRSTITRWVYQMGVTVDKPENHTLVIHENSVPILFIPYGFNKRLWKPVEDSLAIRFQLI